MTCVLILAINSTATTSALPMERPTGFHGPARVQLVPKRAEERLTVVLSFFREPELLLVHNK